MDIIGGINDEWMESALCSQTDPDAFFPEHRSTGHAARTICQSCDVRAECLRDALVNHNNTPDGKLYGIWGGYGTTSRRKILKELTLDGTVAVPDVEHIREWLAARGEIKKQGGNRWG